MPDWQERHVPDLGITLVELLAYVGDYLSYYQDAVATEAYLDTARQRISVRRHARLVDYRLHEGCNARAWVLRLDNDSDLPDCPQTTFTSSPALPASRSAGPVMKADDLQQVPSDAYEVFEPLVDGRRQDRSRSAPRTARSSSTPGATTSAACRGRDRRDPRWTNGSRAAQPGSQASVRGRRGQPGRTRRGLASGAAT